MLLNYTFHVHNTGIRSKIGRRGFYSFSHSLGSVSDEINEIANRYTKMCSRKRFDFQRTLFEEVSDSQRRPADCAKPKPGHVVGHVLDRPGDDELLRVEHVDRV